MEQLRRKIDQLLASKPNRATSEYREFVKLTEGAHHSNDVKKLIKLAALLQKALRTPNPPKKEPIMKRRKRIKMTHQDRREDHQLFLQSDHWVKTKDRAKKMGLYEQCYCCGAKDRRLDLHHTTYKYKGTRAELKKCKGLVAVCRKCHIKIHEVESSERVNVSKATAIVKNQFSK